MATRGIIKGSIVDYQITFSVPTNDQITALLIRDDLPEGLTYATDPGVTWLGLTTSPDLNVKSAEYAPADATTDPATPYTPSRVQMYITDTTITQTGGEFTINIPSKVVDVDKLVENSPVTNTYELYSSVSTSVTAPAIGSDVDTTIWTMADGTENDSSDTFTSFNILLNGGLVDIDNTLDTDTPNMSSCNFNILNSVPSAEVTSDFNYILTFGLDSHLKGMTDSTAAKTAIKVFYLDGRDVNSVDTDFNVDKADGAQYVLTIPVTDKIRGQILHVFVPFGLKESVDDTDFDATGKALLRNPLTVSVQDSQTTAVTVVPAVDAFADVRVTQVVEIPKVSFGGKTLN